MNIITKFDFDVKIPKFYLHMIKYRIDLIFSFYKTFKKTKAYLNVFNTKV